MWAMDIITIKAIQTEFTITQTIITEKRLLIKSETLLKKMMKKRVFMILSSFLVSITLMLQVIRTL